MYCKKTPFDRSLTNNKKHIISVPYLLLFWNNTTNLTNLYVSFSEKEKMFGLTTKFLYLEKNWQTLNCVQSFVVFSLLCLVYCVQFIVFRLLCSDYCVHFTVPGTDRFLPGTHYPSVLGAFSFGRPSSLHGHPRKVYTM